MPPRCSTAWNAAQAAAAVEGFVAGNYRYDGFKPEKERTPGAGSLTLVGAVDDGAVAAAREGMRLVYGPMSGTEAESFRKTWGVLRQHPSDDAVDYLNRFNPLLGEFLSLRGAVAEASARLADVADLDALAAIDAGPRTTKIPPG